jgi:UDP-N-acetyl-2-amino-2-deoxyglucuronate dehydrogenase
MKTNLRFALIGCGRIAQRHAEHIGNFGTLVAICDIDEGKATDLANRTGARPYFNIESLLADSHDVDVVSICTPNGLHAAHSIKALNAGCHVLCEKPMATSSEDCGEMIKTAERMNRRLFCIKQNRFNPPVAAVKKLIEEGRLGRIYSFQLNCFWNRNADYYKNSWRGTLHLDGGTLFTQFSHFIDLLYWFFGDVRNVDALINNYGHLNEIEFEDTGVAIMEFKNGIIGAIHYTVNSYGKNMEGSITIFGEKGTVKIGGQYLNELEYQNIEGYKIENLPQGGKPNDYGTYQGSMSNHSKVYQNVIDVLTGNATISTNAYEGQKTVEIIEKIYSTARTVCT